MRCLVGPDAQTAVFGQAIAADARAGKNHVGVRRPDLDGLDHLGDIDAVAFGEHAPFVQKRQCRGAIGILDDLAGFAFDGPVQDGQGKFFDIQRSRRGI